MVSLYEALISYQETDLILSQIPTGTADKITVNPNTEDGTIFNIKEVAYQSIASSYTSRSSHREERAMSKLFDINTITLPRPMQVTSMIPKLLEDPKVYGVLGFTKDNQCINLGHFLTPKPNLLLPISRVVVYSYVNYSDFTSSMYYKEELAQIAKIYTATLSHSYYHIYTVGGITNIKDNKFYFHKWDTIPSCNITSAKSTILPASESSEHGIIPLFFVGKGIVYPYYGVSGFIFTSTSKKGYDLTSFVSANITSRDGSICTGSLPNTEYESYRGLNYSNLDSPYRRDIMPTYYQEIAQAYKDFMIELYKGLNNESN